MKTIFALLALSISTAAFSECYSIYSESNELVWQGTTAPVSMATLSISDEVRKLVPKGHMVIADSDAARCPALDLIKRTTMRQKADDMKYD